MKPNQRFTVRSKDGRSQIPLEPRKIDWTKCELCGKTPPQGPTYLERHHWHEEGPRPLKSWILVCTPRCHDVCEAVEALEREPELFAKFLSMRLKGERL